jgi:hypothetical protein
MSFRDIDTWGLSNLWRSRAPGGEIALAVEPDDREDLANQLKLLRASIGCAPIDRQVTNRQRIPDGRTL